MCRHISAGLAVAGAHGSPRVSGQSELSVAEADPTKSCRAT